MTTVAVEVNHLMECSDWQLLQQLGHDFVDRLSRSDGTYFRSQTITRELFRRAVTSKFDCEVRQLLQQIIGELRAILATSLGEIMEQRVDQIRKPDKILLLEIGRRQQTHILEKLQKIQAVAEARPIKVLLIANNLDWQEEFARNFSFTDDFLFLLTSNPTQLDQLISNNPDIAMMVIYAPLGFIYGLYYVDVISKIRGIFDGWIIVPYRYGFSLNEVDFQGQPADALNFMQKISQGRKTCKT